WQLLYEFPLLETDEELTQEVTVASTINWLSENSIGAENQYDRSQVTQYYKHQLTHQKLFVRFVVVNVDEGIKIKDFIKIEKKSLEFYAIPKIIHSYLSENNYF
ncbi:MAG: hypothetical protein KBA06_02245, partial [Saprospiraceae bacterium]|nr:hypothetical protein [Saprospiraceae bacterium]